MTFTGTRPVKGTQKMIANMTPVLQPGTFVFCAMIHNKDATAAMTLARGTFVEDEGLSLILPRGDADRLGLSYETPMKQITLMVYSSVQGVGLTAAVAKALTKKKIPANVVSATQHDHVFVPAELANDALETLRDLQSAAQDKLSR
ncbi:MAG: ACT domain-containing protein [Silicimonas sp.]|nr:ACT domain-containing protein [Silicimonas sp.]NND21640.1 ACT domain-containing protein [Silicimonas sp.]NNF91819.1 ACT domain-containing protein [Boseongicola sp.]